MQSDCEDDADRRGSSLYRALPTAVRTTLVRGRIGLRLRVHPRPETARCPRASERVYELRTRARTRSSLSSDVKRSPRRQLESDADVTAARLPLLQSGGLTASAHPLLATLSSSSRGTGMCGGARRSTRGRERITREGVSRELSRLGKGFIAALPPRKPCGESNLEMKRALST